VTSKEQARKDFWDITLWPVPQILEWMYAIEVRSDSVISEAMYTEDWSDHDSDQRMHDKLCKELRRRGLDLRGKPIARELYKMAYRLVRLKTYESEVYEQWDYAHNPSDEEICRADLMWDVVLDCRKCLAELKPLVEDTVYSIAAVSSYNHPRDVVPGPKLAHLANNFGLAPFSYMPWHTDDRDRYIGHYSWHLDSPWMGEDWNRQNVARFKKRAREVFGLEVQP
jgi:hypothetical protein